MSGDKSLPTDPRFKGATPEKLVLALKRAMKRASKKNQTKSRS